MGQPRPLCHLFLVFSNKHYYFTTNICKKCPSSIWFRDSNPRLSERESIPITTGPGYLLQVLALPILPPNVATRGHFMKRKRIQIDKFWLSAPSGCQDFEVRIQSPAKCYSELLSTITWNENKEKRCREWHIHNSDRFNRFILNTFFLLFKTCHLVLFYI